MGLDRNRRRHTHLDVIMSTPEQQDISTEEQNSDEINQDLYLLNAYMLTIS
jgi:hypothetical protein